MAKSSESATSILAALATVSRRSSDKLPPRASAGFCIEGRVPLDTIAALRHALARRKLAQEDYTVEEVE